jgi:hypothetical protein
VLEEAPNTCTLVVPAVEEALLELTVAETSPGCSQGVLD